MSRNGCSTLTLTQALSSSRFLHVDILHRPNLQSLRRVAVRRSESRCPSLFLVELSAAIMVASTTASALSPRPLIASIALITSKFWRPNRASLANSGGAERWSQINNWSIKQSRAGSILAWYIAKIITYQWPYEIY